MTFTRSRFVALTLHLSGRHRRLACPGCAASRAGGKWDKIAWRQVQGVPAADASGTFKDGRIFRNLVVLKGRQFYSLGFRGPLGIDKITDADCFFASLKVTP